MINGRSLVDGLIVILMFKLPSSLNVTSAIQEVKPICNHLSHPLPWGEESSILRRSQCSWCNLLVTYPTQGNHGACYLICAQILIWVRNRTLVRILDGWAVPRGAGSRCSMRILRRCAH